MLVAARDLARKKSALSAKLRGLTRIEWLPRPKWQKQSQLLSMKCEERHSWDSDGGVVNALSFSLEMSIERP